MLNVEIFDMCHCVGQEGKRGMNGLDGLDGMQGAMGPTGPKGEHGNQSFLVVCCASVYLRS